jgi:hypothetical protein
VENDGNVVTDDWADVAIQMRWDTTGSMPVIASAWSKGYFYGPDASQSNR